MRISNKMNLLVGVVLAVIGLLTQVQAAVGPCHQKISDTDGNFTGTLYTGEVLGNAMVSLGDLDGDSVTDIAVGAAGDDDGGNDRGAVWILFLNYDYTVKSHQKISDNYGNFTGTLHDGDRFGRSITSMGDLDGDGVTDIAVGAYNDDDGGTNAGAVWILFLNTDGTVKSHKKISSTQGSFAGTLDNEDYFGWSVAFLGDVNEDGVGDIAVGAYNDDDGGVDRGAVWILFLNPDGTVKSHQKISDTEGNFTGVLDDGDNFGASMAYLGDRNSNGVIDIAVGATGDDDGGSNKGVVWILFENVYYIDDDANDDPAPGDPAVSDPNENGSPEHPFDSIQKAMSDADQSGCDCATVIVRDGIYSGQGNYDIDPCGLAVTIESQNGPDYSMIDCNDQGRAFIFQTGEDANTVLAGLTITGGDSDRDDYACKSGGAIYCNGTSPTIKDCTFIGNYALWSGGAIYVGPNSSSLIEQCRIILNDCDVAAGGIYSYMSNPVIKNCLIVDNFGYWSGAISSNGYSNSTIINCTIADNFAVNGPSGIECYYYTNATVMNSILWNTDNIDEQIYLEEEGTVTVDYSDVQMADGNTWDGNNINADPLFAAPQWFDYHLKSAAGRWTPFFETNGDFDNDGFIDFFDFAIFASTWQDTGAGMPTDFAAPADNVVDYNDLAVFVSNWLAPGLNISGWVSDSVTSPCIDAGDPDSDYSQEPDPNGGRINMGAYGNTSQASKSPY